MTATPAPIPKIVGQLTPVSGIGRGVVCAEAVAVAVGDTEGVAVADVSGVAVGVGEAVAVGLAVAILQAAIFAVQDVPLQQ